MDGLPASKLQMAIDSLVEAVRAYQVNPRDGNNRSRLSRVLEDTQTFLNTPEAWVWSTPKTYPWAVDISDQQLETLREEMERELPELS